MRLGTEMTVTGRPRGRPRSYDPDQALERALQTFWKGGYSSTSLDALSAATGLNRPSLYAGLGDKRTIYVKAMQRFQEHARQNFGVALESRPDDRSFADVIKRYLQAAIAVDGPQESGVSGCAVISTAMAEALNDPEIRKVLDGVLKEMDDQLINRLNDAKRNSELSKDADIQSIAILLTSTVHSIGIRARAGSSREEIQQIVDSLMQTLSKSKLIDVCKQRSAAEGAKNEH